MLIKQYLCSYGIILQVDNVFIFGRVHTDIAGLMVDRTAEEMYDKTGNIRMAQRNTEAH
jgi:hypothetical protein